MKRILTDKCLNPVFLSKERYISIRGYGLDKLSIMNLNVLLLTVCRYSRHDKRSKLPGWILSHLHDAHLNLSTDMALHIAREVCVL